MGNCFSYDEKQILRRMQCRLILFFYFFMNMEIPSNFETLKLG